MSEATETCPGCGMVSVVTEGPVHKYMLSSPACWAIYGDLLAREYEDAAFFEIHQLSVDAYAVSHPGEPGRRSIQSVGLHLMTLLLFLDQGLDVATGPAMHKRIIKNPPKFRWLDPPDLTDRMNCAAVLEASCAQEHIGLVRGWASEVWEAWAPHHPAVRQWVESSLGSADGR